MNRRLLIEGMTCGHCVMHIESALKEVDGVITVKVDLEGKYAIVGIDNNVENANLIQAVEEAGYTVTGIEEK